MTLMMHRSDQDLEASVSDELLFTPSVDTHVQVSARDGAVTLSGDVGSLPERLAATRAAERVWGVRTITDKMVVRTAGASGANDSDIEAAASHMLAWSTDVPLNAVTVGVRDRVVTLSGAVTWDYQRRAAARVVTYLKGVNGVKNNVTLAQGESVSVTKAAVEAAIARNAPLDAQAITVQVDGHELTLLGSVRSSAERHQAEHAAWAAAGVTNVKNELFITS